eukprot:356106-Chlamydomonas_euryale.AAC.4
MRTAPVPLGKALIAATLPQPAEAVGMCGNGRLLSQREQGGRPSTPASRAVTGAWLCGACQLLTLEPWCGASTPGPTQPARRRYPPRLEHRPLRGPPRRQLQPCGNTFVLQPLVLQPLVLQPLVLQPFSWLEGGTWRGTCARPPVQACGAASACARPCMQAASTSPRMLAACSDSALWLCCACSAETAAAEASPAHARLPLSSGLSSGLTI